MSNGLFDNVDDDDDIFKDIEEPKTNRETTPEFFNKVEPAGEMNLFSPKKPQDTLFGLDDDEKKGTEDLFMFDDKQDEKNDTKDDLLNLEESNEEPLGFMKEEEPLGFLKDEEATDGDDQEKEEFEVIDSSEVPSVEEAEQQLEIVRQETERRKKEELLKQQAEEKDEGEEDPDGGAFSRILGDRTASTDEEPLTSQQEKEDKDKIIQQLQEEVSELTSHLQSAQAENGSLNSEVSELRQQLNEEKGKNNKLEETIKLKDAEIAALKEALALAPTTASTSSKPPVGKPSLAHRKPSLGITSKQSSISSPRASAKLKQDTEKKSVAETAKRFSQSDSKKASPSLKRSSITKKESVDKTQEHSKIPRQDSAAHRKTSVESHPASSPEKKQSSPPKPSRTKTRSGSQSKADDSPMISNKPQRNTLDAIKMWEQKTGDKKETSPTLIKKSLSSVKSTPSVVSSSNDVAVENGAENLPPVATDELLDSSPEKKDEEKPVKEPKESTEPKSPLRQAGVNTQVRQKKTESMIVPGTKSKRWTPPTVDKCQVCKKTVYPLERLQADEKVYHKTCFRCSHCNKVVGLGTYAANKGDIFCKTHFKMLFKMKGNYDEGFGREQHKKRWNKGEESTAD